MTVISEPDTSGLKTEENTTAPEVPIVKTKLKPNKPAKKDGFWKTFLDSDKVDEYIVSCAKWIFFALFILLITVIAIKFLFAVDSKDIVDATKMVMNDIYTSFSRYLAGGGVGAGSMWLYGKKRNS